MTRWGCLLPFWKRAPVLEEEEESSSTKEEVDEPKEPKHRIHRANSLRGNFIAKYNKPVDNDYDFDIKTPIGKGAFGAVVVGIKKDSSRAFAIKIIDKGGNLTRIEREIKLLTDLDHANIVRLFSIYEMNDKVVLLHITL